MGLYRCNLSISMRRLIFVALIPFLTAATYYVDATTGGDSNNGTTTSSAWQTMSKVNSTALSAGDSVLFKRGEKWHGNEQLYFPGGTAENRITYDAYGTGAKPILTLSIDENSTGDWVDLGSNLWLNNDSRFTRDVGNLVFNNTTCGEKKQSIASVVGQGDFFYNFTTNSVTLYSVGNPAEIYASIECPMQATIAPTSNGNVTVQNLTFAYGARHGTGDGSNVTIRNCDLYFIGGGDHYANYTVRLGNGIEFWNGASDVLVERCTFDQIYDAAITTQGIGTYVKSNITFRNNVINRAEYSIETWERNDTATVNNISFVFNTCRNAGGGWGHNQRWDGPNGRHLYCGVNTATVFSPVVIKNNIFDTATESAIRLGVVDNADYDINSNLYNVTVVAYFAGNYTSLADWQAVSGQDTSSISGNPIFTFSNRLTKESPARNTATDVGVCVDYDGKPRPIGGGYDIGAFEYGNWLHGTINNATFN